MSRDDGALALFERVVDLDPRSQDRVLAQACGGDEALLERVRRLLRANARPHALLDQPPGALLEGPPGPPQERWEGRELGPYRVIRELGRGGMGVVYLAERGDVGVHVALKLVEQIRSSPERMARFGYECRVLAQLEHPHIARFLDAGILGDGTAWLAMEYVEGSPIDAHADAHCLSVAERLDLLERVADAVAHAHRSLLVHRDIKPSNVLVSAAGVPKLVDFGIAMLLNAREGADPAAPGACGPMTPEYASPEQVRCEALTTASDVYQLGILMHELVTGRRPVRPDGEPLRPFDRAAAGSMVRPSSLVMTEVLPEQLPGGPSARTAGDLSALRRTTPRKLRGQLRGDVDAMIETSMRPEPSARYASAGALVEDLRRLRSGRPLSARPASYAYRAGRLIRRHRIAAVFAAALVAVGAASATAFLVQAHHVALERDRAEKVSQVLERLVRYVNPSTSPDSAVGLTVLREVSAQGRAGLSSEPDVWARIMIPVGTAYREMDRLDVAIGIWRDVIDALEPRVPPNDPQLLETMGLLGTALVMSGDFDGGLPMLDRLVGQARGLAEDRRSDLASSLYSAGFGRQIAGDDEAARRLYGDALSLLLSLPDSGGLVYDRTLLNLGYLVQRQGYPDSASRLFRAAVTRRIARDGPAADRTLNAQAALARSLITLGALDEAESMSDSVLTIRRRQFPSPHTTLADALDVRAALLAARGRLPEAERVRREALDMYRAAYGDEHFVVALMQARLAKDLVDQDRLREALSLQREAVARYRRTAGDRHPGTVEAIVQLAGLERAASNVARAESLYREALPTMEARLGGRPSLFEPLTAFGQLLAEAGRCTEAIPYLRRGLATADAQAARADARTARVTATLERCSPREGAG